MSPVNPVTPVWRCTRRIGFLFPHECGSMSPVGCRHCNGGQLNDPYSQYSNRYGYDDYDVYHPSVFSFWPYQHHDFTEADGGSMIRSRKHFEEDMSAS